MYKILFSSYSQHTKFIGIKPILSMTYIVLIQTFKVPEIKTQKGYEKLRDFKTL